jgi:hypothetical protein
MVKERIITMKKAFRKKTSARVTNSFVADEECLSRLAEHNAVVYY